MKSTGRQEKVVHCNAEECSYHELTKAVVGDMKSAVDRITEGQQQMRESLVQLTEAIKQMDRLERRLDKIEEEKREDTKEQDVSIRNLEKNYYKAAGAVGVLVVVVQIALKIFVGV